MAISGEGWELHIVRQSEQKRESDGKRRTVGRYLVYHDGAAQSGADLKGVVAETRGPGANTPAGNNRRVEAGRLRAYLGAAFPSANGKKIPRAFAVIDGEPT